MTRQKKNKYSSFTDRFVFEVIERYIERGQSPTQIREAMGLRRESFYPVFEQARQRGFLKVCAPAHRSLERTLAEAYDVDRDRLHVVNAPWDTACKHVATAAAELALALILELAHTRPRVRVGLGGGWTVGRCAKRLAKLLWEQHELPPLGLHAISTGFDPHQPKLAPSTFFAFFDGLPDVKYVGLSGPSAAPTQTYDAVKQYPGVAQAFDAAKEIDIVLTGLASRQDEHGTLREFARAWDGFQVRALEEAGWVGDLQYAPYSKEGPLEVDAGVRAVTLFELDDLRRLASEPGKHVVVVASPCWRCKAPKTDAVRPLLRSKALRLWTHLVTDFHTAQGLAATA